MTYPTVFGNLAAGNQPASLFDTMFNIAGQQGNITCTATGTNAISLVSITNEYVGTAYTDGQLVSWQAAATSTGAVTMQWSGLGFLNYYTAAGIQAQSGDIVINTNYISQYRANLNAGNGGFITLNATVTAISNPVAGTHKNVKITNGGTPATQVALTADAVIAQNASGGTVRLTTVSVTISTASTGANGLDSGTVAASTFYSVWAIYNAGSATTAGLLSTSATSPTLPSGYAYQARLGWVLTDGSANLWRFIQLNMDFQFVQGTNPTAALFGAAPFLVASGNLGTYSATSPVLASVSLPSAAGSTAIVPSTASKVALLCNPDWKGAGSSNLLVAPNTSWGGTNNGPNGTNGNTYPYFNAANNGTGAARIEMVLEAASIAVASSGSNSVVQVIGWTDNV